MPTPRNTAISQLTLNTTPTGNDLLPVVNAGITKKITLNGISQFFQTSAGIYVTGGTYDANSGILTFTNTSGGTFNVTGLTKNSKHFIYNETRTIDVGETLVISDNYALNNSNLFVATGTTDINIGGVDFNDNGEIFIGGNLLVLNSNIVNNGEINVAGAIFLVGTSTITGSGIII